MDRLADATKFKPVSKNSQIESASAQGNRGCSDITFSNNFFGFLDPSKVIKNALTLSTFLWILLTPPPSNMIT